MYVDTNRELWNLWTKLNAASKECSDLLMQLKAGRTTLEKVELEELNDVAGKTLLHLQCHFGLDTFSWAREGAIVTGVDISEEAIVLARSLSQELNIEAEFICSDIYDLPARLNAQFDIVYTMSHPPHMAYYWPHSLGEIITALCSARLRIEFLHEFPETVEERPYEEVGPDRYELRVHREVAIPGQLS
jgi:SAM-dependent methyltransferase